MDCCHGHKLGPPLPSLAATNGLGNARHATAAPLHRVSFSPSAALFFGPQTGHPPLPPLVGCSPSNQTTNPFHALFDALTFLTREITDCRYFKFPPFIPIEILLCFSFIYWFVYFLKIFVTLFDSKFDKNLNFG